MNRRLACAVFVGVAFSLGVAWWLARPLAHRAPPAAALPGQPARAVPAADTLATTLRPPLADALGAAGTPPEAEPGIVLAVLEAYRRGVGGFPVGEDNRQIVRALLGANAARLPFLPRDHPRLNARGELLDAWGRPFFFHLLSRERIGVRSAGPDREFHNADDIVAGPG